MLEARDQAGTNTTTTTNGGTAAIGQEEHSSGGGGRASDGNDPHQSSLSQGEAKLKTHHKLEAMATAVRVFKVRFYVMSKGLGAKI